MAISFTLRAFVGAFAPLSGSGPVDKRFSTAIEGNSVTYSVFAERLVSFGAELTLIVPSIFGQVNFASLSGESFSFAPPLMEAGLRVPLSLGPYVGRLGIVLWANDEVKADRSLSGNAANIFKWLTFDITLPK